jgi:hypothetical protein
VAVPDLSGSGYRFMCGRLVATAYEQAALHMYGEDHGTRLVMLARTMATEQNAKMSPLAQVAIDGFAWVDHGMGYGFVESPPTEALHPMPMRRAARGVSKEWGIMPRWPTARSGWRVVERDVLALSGALHCRPRSGPGAGARHLFGTSVSAATCSFAD